MRRPIAVITSIAILCACSADNRDDTIAPDRTVPLHPSQVQLTAALTSFESCEPFLRHVKANALEMVGPWGLDGGYAIAVMEGSELARDGSQAIADSSQSALAPGVDYSTTNVQEAGVDEPDILKTDGTRIVALVNEELRVVDITGDQPRSVGKLRFEKLWPQEMFLVGDRILVFGQSHGGTQSLTLRHGPYSPISTIVEIDISGPKPRITRRLHVDGGYLGSRMVDDVVRIVVQSQPTGLEWSYPSGAGLRAERRAEEENRRLIEESTSDNWIPWFALENARGRLIEEGTLTPCDRIYHPPSNSGLQMLNIITVDLSEEQLGDKLLSTSVLADGQTVYSSKDNLYVATTEWFDWRELEADEDDTSNRRPPLTTRIHKFDISDPNNTLYRTSGQVLGTVLNQYSMSEHKGRLRVATTNHGWWGPGDVANSESYVTVLSEEDGELVELGRVGDLGRGERIYAVRFLGDLATVVTFRQTDPLYTIDLSDPRSPTVLGELKILGYSAYLHPVTETLLLGIGQDADDDGRTVGTQVSLFDISDLTDPVRVDQWRLLGGHSEIEYNPRAFLHWPAENLFVLPVATHRVGTAESGPFSGAVALELNNRSLTERGRLTHLKTPPKVRCDQWVEEREDGSEISRQQCWADIDWRATIQRSVVIKNEIYTLSSLGLLASDLRTLEQRAFLLF